ALFWGAVLPLIGSRLAFFDRLAELRILHARSIRATAEADTLRAAIEQRGQAADEDALFLQGATRALAGAELQDRLKSMIEIEGGILVSTAFGRDSAQLPVEPITVIVRVRSSIEALLRFLYTIEAHQPRLFTENLTIQSRHRTGQPMGSPVEELDVELEVTGY